MPPKGIVLPLNDRPTSRILTHRPDPPATAGCSFYAAYRAVNQSLKKHFAPVCRPRNRARQSAAHRNSLNFFGQPKLCCFRMLTGSVQPEESRTGPRQRGIEGCLRCVRSRENTLDFCKGRMLGKDNTLEVILDPARDPGADKRGLLWSGQVLSA